MLSTIRDAAWLWVAGPLLGVAGVWLTFRLAAPQVVRLAAGFRALSAHDPDTDGDVPPAAGTWLAAAASLGAAAAVGAATAVALGGAGAILWVWLIGLLLAPLRFTEALLARTGAPGDKGGAAGSLAARLAREGGGLRVLGLVMAALAAASALLFVGGVHGDALVDASERLLPGSMPAVGVGVAAMAAILAAGGMRRSGAIAGWLAVAAMTVLLAAAIWAAASDPGRAVGALGRTFSEAFGGAPAATPFVGAFAGEIARAAILSVLPPIAGATGVAGALHGAARARTTRGQAAAALLGPLAYAVLTTVLCMAFVATGAYYRRVEDRRPMSEVRVYAAAFETASQRAEPERLHDGYVRVEGGEMRDVGLHFGTDQGTIRSPRFLYRGEPADIALHVRGGEPFRFLVPRDGVLTTASLDEVRHVVVEGEMLPRGGALLGAALARGTGGDVGPRLGLGALLVLLAVGAGAFGLGAGRSLGAGAPPWARVAVALLPAAGLALAATGLVPWLSAAGGLAAASLASATAVALLIKSGEARKLLGE